MTESPSLPELRCDDCAFKVGTDASMSERTVLLANLCVDALEIFNCHRRNGICAGWAECVNQHGAEWYKTQPAWKQALRRGLIDLINRPSMEDFDAEMDALMDRIEKGESR